MKIKNIVAMFLMMPGSFVILSYGVSFLSAAIGLSPIAIVAGMLILGIGVAAAK